MCLETEWSWFKTEKRRGKWLPEELCTADGKREFQRELGAYLGMCEIMLRKSPQTTLESLDSYYEKAFSALNDCAVTDTITVTYLTTVCEMLGNFIQMFRRTHNLSPSKKVNESLSVYAEVKR